MSLALRLPSLTPRRTPEKYMSIVVVYQPKVQKKIRLVRQDQDGGFNNLQKIQRHVQIQMWKTGCVTLGTRKLNSIQEINVQL